MARTGAQVFTTLPLSAHACLPVMASPIRGPSPSLTEVQTSPQMPRLSDLGAVGRALAQPPKLPSLSLTTVDALSLCLLVKPPGPGWGMLLGTIKEA